MARYTSTVPLNMVYRHRLGAVIEIVADRRNGIALPAGTPFDIPDDLAADFESEMGPRPNAANQSNRDGRIPGLAKVE
jgi:hypothetical protein